MAEQRACQDDHEQQEPYRHMVVSVSGHRSIA
jgi:hypothetical protein